MMRAVTSVTSRDDNIDGRCRHLEMMSCFAARVAGDAESVETRKLTMILRSAASSPVRALIGQRQELASAGIDAKVILANLEPEEDLHQLFASLCELSPRTQAIDLIRWARNPRLLDAHEQVIYGDTMCWSGDAMRRDANRRNAMALFEEEAPQEARFGRLAFGALWAASALIPERRLLGQAKARPSGAYQASAEAPVAVSAFKPGFQGWPLIRH
jgi:hypothetical protein